MKPRIFVSSTFYDLKYVREDLANFIRTYNFEPILFEEGDIGYESGKPLDNSCYDAMRTSDMAILIIGGQHGTNATNQTDENSANFISITQQEFISAVHNNIPVFAFVDAKVYTEYDLYKENIEKIKKDSNHISFRATKDIRVFEFIRNIYGLGSIPVNEFSKIQDIKDFLSKQWSDMFKKYLNQRKENKEIETIKLSVSKLESIVDQMSIMMEAIGKNVLNQNNEYDIVKIQQKIQAFFTMLNKYILFDSYNTILDDTFPERFVKAITELNSIYITNITPKNFEGIFLKHKIVILKVKHNIVDFLLDFHDYLCDPQFQKEMKKHLEKDFLSKLSFAPPLVVTKEGRLIAMPESE